jgi:Carboxypeptidase regulatory-like domain
LRGKLVLIAPLLFLLSLSGIAQSNYAVLSGTILDPQAHAITGATVELVSSTTGAVRRVSPNAQGLYEIPGLLPGSYGLKVTAPGFGTSVQPLQLEVAQRLAIDIRLQVESHQEAVEVTGVPEAIHTNEAAVGEVIEPTAIANLPLGNVGRNSVYGPGMQTLDFAVARIFSVTEKAKFQFRGEFFNALNHTNLGTPDRFVNTPQFGTVTEATTPGRQIQLSARLSF